MSTNTMTVTQVRKALAKVGAVAEVSGKGREWTVEFADDVNYELYHRVIGAHSGVRTGYGAWIVRPGYRPSTDDYCMQADELAAARGGL